MYSVRKFYSVPNVTGRVTEPVGRRISGNYAVEGGFAWGKQTHVVEAHFCQCACEDQVEPASAVDEYSSKL